tara:strand:- start:210 stop:716 length:507 start_codon:yes stop_codon:yes gene_type:complete
MENLSIWVELLGSVGILITLIFLVIQTRTANKLAIAESQREQRHIWQEMMFFMADNSSEYREFVNNYDGMDPDRQTKAVMAFFAMGNQLDTLLKLKEKGLETDDTIRYSLDAFVGHMSTKGGNKFWNEMVDIDFYGDNVLNAVGKRLKEMNAPNDDFIKSAKWLRPDN